MSSLWTISWLTLALALGATWLGTGDASALDAPKSVELPAPDTGGEVPLEQTIEDRRSVRSWARSPVTLQELSQLLWAAQGITARDGRRSAPSAGAKYPIEITVVVERVDGLDPGLYRYDPERHLLRPVAAGRFTDQLTAAALSQNWMRSAPASLVIAGVVARTASKYGARAPRYVHMEVGAVAENVYLQATALGLGTTFVGAFDDEAVSRVAQLSDGESPFAILPFGRRP